MHATRNPARNPLSRATDHRDSRRFHASESTRTAPAQPHLSPTSAPPDTTAAEPGTPSATALDPATAAGPASPDCSSPSRRRSVGGAARVQPATATGGRGCRCRRVLVERCVGAGWDAMRVAALAWALEDEGQKEDHTTIYQAHGPRTPSPQRLCGDGNCVCSSR